MTAMVLPAGSLWARIDERTGEPFYAGTFGKLRIAVLPCEKRKPDDATHALVIVAGQDNGADLGPFRAVGNQVNPQGRRKGAQPAVRSSKLAGPPA